MLRFFRDSHRWNTNFVTLSEFGFRLHTTTVQAHFARSQNAVNVRLRDAFEFTNQKIVDALPRVRHRDAYAANCWGVRGFGIFVNSAA
jgi:hypothetical protein